MPIANIIKRKVGRELREWLVLGIRTGMRRGVAEYRQLIVMGQPLRAEQAIKRAIDLPHRARSRIDHAITVYGQNAVVSAFTDGVDVTVAELNAELAALEAYAQLLVDRRNTDPTGTGAWDALATDIETNVELESERWTFQIPPGYVDIWGE